MNSLRLSLIKIKQYDLWIKLQLPTHAHTHTHTHTHTHAHTHRHTHMHTQKEFNLDKVLVSSYKKFYWNWY